MAYRRLGVSGFRRAGVGSETANGRNGEWAKERNGALGVAFCRRVFKSRQLGTRLRLVRGARS